MRFCSPAARPGPSDSFSAVHLVGYFDTIEEMDAVYEMHKGNSALVADRSGWRLEK